MVRAKNDVPIGTSLVCPYWLCWNRQYERVRQATAL